MNKSPQEEVLGSHYKDSSGNVLGLPEYIFVDGCVNNNCKFAKNANVTADIAVNLPSSASYAAIGSDVYVKYSILTMPYPVGDVCSKLEVFCLRESNKTKQKWAKEMAPLVMGKGDKKSTSGNPLSLMYGVWPVRDKTSHFSPPSIKSLYLSYCRSHKTLLSMPKHSQLRCQNNLY
uniref:Uncharacterized protein n=1 Tax=Lutzomyia longipalpis TaxID=7200 RepID=A0A1B0CSN8_LUTLO